MERTTHTLRWMHTKWTDERVVTSEKSANGIEEKMPGDFKRSEFNEFVENLTGLNALERNFGKEIRTFLMDD